MNRKERRAAQKRGTGARIVGGPGAAVSAEQAAQLFAQAARHRQNGELSAAEALCRSILAAFPGHAGSLYILGTIAMQVSRPDVAAEWFRKAIASEPRNAAFHNDMGLALQMLGRIDDAIGSFRRAIKFEPDNSRAYNNLAVALRAQGKLPEAAAQFARALELTSELFDQYASVVETLLDLSPTVAAAISRAASAWPRRLMLEELFGTDGYPAVAGDPLLQCMLAGSEVRDTAFERMLTSTRCALLKSATGQSAGAADEDDVKFRCAMARQCFINEYVFALTAEELLAAEQLRDSLAVALAAKSPVQPHALAAVASYFAINTIPDSSSLLDRAVYANWPAPIEELLTLQLREPLEERRLRETMPAMTPIDDATSLRVKQQYEENPYPRWILPPSRGEPQMVDELLRQHFSDAAFRSFGKTDGVDVLIAGCGTGLHPIGLAQQISGARVLAIDLSRASLAYAQRKSRELNFSNISYALADILKLGSIGRTFDVIDASGVLHHLADPESGWRVLLSLLRPNGLMRVGLYSELGRRHVAEARAFCAKRGFSSTAEGIRAAREELAQAQMSVARSYDFFSTSECRDLLFHVQEQTFTIARIRTFLAAHELRFIGFTLSAPAATAAAEYVKRFPDDPGLSDLDHWEEFEPQWPDTFRGMYQFWVQKE